VPRDHQFLTLIQTALVALGAILAWVTIGWVLWGGEPGKLLFLSSAVAGIIFGGGGFLLNPKAPWLTRWTALLSVAMIAGASTLAYLLASSTK